MQALKDEEVGDFIIRPSSQGMDMLSITRKVWGDPERYSEVVIKMFDQPNKTGLGRTLSVEDKFFEDLDEMIIGYVEVMVKMDKKLTEHDKFFGGDAKDIRTKLIEQKQAAGGKGTPYCLGFNPTPVSSDYILFWLPGNKAVREEKVKVTLGGYVFREQHFQSPSRLINWFKSHAMDLHKQQNQHQQAPPPAYKPPQDQGGWGGGMGGPPHHAPPPVQWGMGSTQGPPRGPPPGAPPAAAAGYGPPGGNGGWGGGLPPPQYQPPPPAYAPPGYGGPPGMAPPPNQPPTWGPG